MAAENITILRTMLRVPWHILLVAAVLVTVGSLALYSASGLRKVITRAFWYG